MWVFYSDVPGSYGYLKFASRLENCSNWFKNQIKKESPPLLSDRSSVKVKPKHTMFTTSSFMWDDLWFSLRLLICLQLMNLPRRPWQWPWRLKSGYRWTRHFTSPGISRKLESFPIFAPSSSAMTSIRLRLLFNVSRGTANSLAVPVFIQSFVKV